MSCLPGEPTAIPGASEAEKYTVTGNLVVLAVSELRLDLEPARQSPDRKVGRKVRAPADRVPGNAWGARAHGKCHRKYTAAGLNAGGKGEKVR